MANAVQASLLPKGRAVLGPTPWSGLISGGTTALSGGRARDAGLSISSSSRLASRCLAKKESDPPEATLSQAARAPLTDRTTRLGQTAAGLVLHLDVVCPPLGHPRRTTTHSPVLDSDPFEQPAGESQGPNDQGLTPDPVNPEPDQLTRPVKDQTCRVAGRCSVEVLP